MTREEVRALLERHHQALNRHDVAGLTAMYAENAVVKSPIYQTIRGLTEIEHSFEMLFKLWPDYQVNLDDSSFICEEDGRAVEFGRVTASHSSELFGLPPTGDRIEYEVVRQYTIRDHRIEYEHRIYDLVGVLERFRKSRLESELASAAEIQRTLLPRTRHTGPFFEVVGASLPSRAISGDFFEYVDLPSGDFGLALGDVSGKGPAAALVASMLQGILSVEARVATSPSTTLSRVNRALRRRGMESRYATLVYGMLSPNGSFRYSNAGQIPPILLTEQGVRRLSTGGPMLGVFDSAAFPEQQLSLHPGDALLLYSDGVTEALNRAGEEFTDARLVECIEGRYNDSPQAILDTLVGEVRAFCGDASQHDDITIVVAQFR
jgi:predicted ester cyclase